MKLSRSQSCYGTFWFGGSEMVLIFVVCYKNIVVKVKWVYKKYKVKQKLLKKTKNTCIIKV